MRQLLLFLALLATFPVSHVAHAEQGCPAGQYPQQGQGWRSCVPIPGYDGGQSGSYARPPIVRQDQWQAVALDRAKMILGVSTGMLTPEGAESEALRHCRTNGGSACSIEISLANGCAAMAAGKSKIRFRGAKTKSEAEKAAMAQCQSVDSGCQVTYSDCSIPFSAL